MSNIKLTFNSNEYNVSCSNITIGWKSNTVAKANANGTEAVEVQTQSFENPSYSLQGVGLIEGAGNLTYAILLDMAKNKYNGSNGITLTVDYGVGGTDLLVGSDGTTTDIPVVIKSFNFPIDTKEYDDDGTRRHILTGSIMLMETA